MNYPAACGGVSKTKNRKKERRKRRGIKPCLRFNETINSTLQTLGNFFEVDRTYISLFDPQFTHFKQSYEWVADGIEPHSPTIAKQPMEQFEWAMKKLQDLKPLIISRAAGIPPGAAEKELWDAHTGASVLSIPIAIDGKLVGVLGFAADRREVVWDDDDINLLKLAAEVFANALARKQAEIQITDSLTEKEILLREVHRRVKNNLQVISSLLMLQSGAVQDENTRQVLKDSHNRVRSMALVHEMLYKSPNLASVNANSYVQDVTRSLQRAYDRQYPPLRSRYRLMKCCWSRIPLSPAA